MTLPGLKAALPELPGIVRATGMVTIEENLDREEAIARLASRGQVAWLPKTAPDDSRAG